MARKKEDRAKKCRSGKVMMSRTEAMKLMLSPKLAEGGVYGCRYCGAWHRTRRPR